MRLIFASPPLRPLRAALLVAVFVLSAHAANRYIRHEVARQVAEGIRCGPTPAGAQLVDSSHYPNGVTRCRYSPQIGALREYLMRPNPPKKPRKG